MVEDLIRRARRRFLLNEALAQFAFAAAVFIGGFVLLLIVGARYLEWWALALFAAAGLAIAGWRIYRRTPDPFTTAVRVDENAYLHDALSTALYFSAHPPRETDAKETEAKETAGFREFQRRQADQAAGEVRLEEVVPFVVPRSLYAMATLCVLASVLIGLRFWAVHRLDLEAPLAQLLFEDEALHNTNQARSLHPKAQPWQEEANSLLSKLGAAPKPNDPLPSTPDALDQALEQALENPDAPAGKGQKGNGSGNAGQTKAGQASRESPNGDPIDDSEQQASSDRNSEENAALQANQADSKSAAARNGSQNNRQSLLSRLKEAVSNMLSRSASNQDTSAQKNQEASQNQRSESQQAQGGKGGQQTGESQSDAEGQPDSDAQGAQQAQGKLNSSNQTPGQGGSGIGTQDGSKEIKAAEQLKAMGKISEIIGQRAATVSGETSVEVQSGSQKLQTDYSNTSATHGEADGDVTRDEIPLALESYVQQYFTEVRKAGKAKASPKPQDTQQ